MGDIVYTHTDSLGGTLVTEGQVPVDRKTTVFAGSNKVAMVNSYRIVGVPRGCEGTDKRYSYWCTVNSFGFFRNRAGAPQPYVANRQWNKKEPWRHANAFPVFNLFAQDDFGAPAFKHAAWEAFGITKMEDVYPMASRYGLPSYQHLPIDLRPAMRHDTWEAFTTHAFGKTRATPRLIAAVQQTEPYIVSIAHAFRGFVTDEVLLKFIENTHFDDEMMEGFRLHSPNVRGIVKHLHNPAALLNNGLDLADTIRIQEMCRGANHKYYARCAQSTPNATSWAELMSS